MLIQQSVRPQPLSVRSTRKMLTVGGTATTAGSDTETPSRSDTRVRKSLLNGGVVLFVYACTTMLGA